MLLISFCSGLHLYDNDIKNPWSWELKNAASVIEQEGAQNGLIKI